MRITDKVLEAKVERLNYFYGYKTPPKYKRLKSGKFKAVGKGFKLYFAYGRVQLTYANYAKNTGEYDISGLLTRPNLADVIDAMIKGYNIKKKGR